MPTVLMCVKGQSRGGWKEQEGGGERTDYLKEEKFVLVESLRCQFQNNCVFFFFSLLLTSTINCESIVEL